MGAVFSTLFAMSNSELGLKGPRGRVLLAIMMATGLAALDSTILATALPAIVTDLKDYAQFPWLFSIYLLAQAVTVPLYSKLADVVGRKPILIFGIVLFVVSSLLCGVAWSMPILILGRALQGLGAGAINPMTQTVVGDLYTVEERAKVQGYIGAVWAMASVVGPALGGFFSEYADWRWIFWVNLPLGGLAIVLLLRNFHETVHHRDHKLDFWGAGVLMVALGALILALLEGGQAWAWTSPISWGLFAGSVILLLVFVRIETKVAEPILPLWVFSRRLLLTTSLGALGVAVVMIGLTSYIPNDLIQALGMSPLVAGVSVAAITLGWPLAVSQSGRLYLKIGFRKTALIGAGLMILSVGGLAVVSASPEWWIFTALCFVAGMGFGLTATPGMIRAQSSVEWNERGVVTGGNQFARAIGSAVGIAVLGAVANAALAKLPGAETIPRNLVLSTQEVLIAAFVVAVLTGVAAWAMPQDAPQTASPAKA